ncbi:sarcosine oxidase subunit gamma [uncultured Roseobacter sp.]|uniref:sarcosine oxidase subunit gamma n=1 Tax=uncultured Roseobacter sp. TaxID=114847 RepID=UPI00262140A3|nr:sarcosine oxidase subunit gamma family protein [uncultured Roseobacter sp.]
MSEPVTALGGASSTDGIAMVSECALQGMITLRGDLSASAFKKAATSASGVAMPEQGMATVEENRGLCWMSPDELLLLCPYDAVGGTLAKVHKTLAKSHALAVNVSDARAMFRVSGTGAREVMAKLCPVDLAPDQFTPGMFRRTRMAQVPAAFWMPEEEVFKIICFRSQAQYVFDLLTVAAQPGSSVGLYQE